MAESIPSLRRQLGEAQLEIHALRLRVEELESHKPETVTVEVPVETVVIQKERVEVPVEVPVVMKEYVEVIKEVIVYVDNPDTQSALESAWGRIKELEWQSTSQLDS